MRFFDAGTEPVGVIAVGAVPTGVIAIGQMSTGVIAIGQGARGFVAVGQLALGFVAFGQLSLGLLWSGGQLALGGTSGVAMLPLGIFGWWNPWRGHPQVHAPGTAPILTLKVLAATAVAALVVLFALEPVVDALVRSGGIFRAPVEMR